MSNVRTDPVTGAKVWLLEDRLDALRECGAPEAVPLSTVENAIVVIGRDPPMAADPLGLTGASAQTLRFPHHGTVSRTHATMQRVSPSCWLIGDSGSSNGVAVDGMPTKSTHVLPGQLIQLGDLQLLAMSARVRAIQHLWTRYLTTRRDPESLFDVDAALWASHWLAMPERRHLFLRGRINDALPWRLHTAWRGPDRPFVCAEAGDGPLTVEELEPLVEQARHGTLFLREHRLGKDACGVLEKLLTSRVAVPIGFIVAAARTSDMSKAAAIFGRTRIVDVPDFAHRAGELPTLIGEAVEAYAPVVGTPPELLLKPGDEEWRHLASRTWAHYDQLEENVRTVIAVRYLGRKAARKLGRSYSYISKFRRTHRTPANGNRARDLTAALKQARRAKK